VSFGICQDSDDDDDDSNNSRSRCTDDSISLANNLDVVLGIRRATATHRFYYHACVKVFYSVLAAVALLQLLRVASTLTVLSWIFMAIL